MPTYDMHQQTFTLSMAVNCASSNTGGSSAIESDLNEALLALLGQPNVQAAIGEWSLVWGSAVWENPLDVRGYSDNTMAVLHSAASNTYVCAIAATNPNSIFDWVVEDGWVHTRVDWKFEPPADDALISMGTNVGITRLLDMKDPATGKSVKDFLASVANTDATLIFAGHSLAGALSPTLALALYGKPEARAAWKQVVVYPTAGATPGNAAFAAAFAKQFPTQSTGSQPWQKWNTLLWNRLDVVPHAWGVPGLSALPTLYKCTWEMETELSVLTAAAILNTDPVFGSPYTLLTNQSLDGTPSQTTPISTNGEFMAELVQQHIDAYFTLIDVPEFHKAYQLAEQQQQPNAQPLEAALAVAQKKVESIKDLGIFKLMGRTVKA